MMENLYNCIAESRWWIVFATGIGGGLTRFAQMRAVSHHEKHPKGWIGVQLLGCSSRTRAFGF